jgi:NADH-quinone oxidoreductase subunit J
MGMTAVETVFYYLAAAGVGSAVLAVTRRNPVHSMLWVLALFLHVAAIFLLLGAEFLAAVQVIVYAGAILVFYLFFVMLLDFPREEAGPRFGGHWPFVVVAAGLTFAAVAWVVADSGAVPAPAESVRLPSGNLSAVGIALFTRFGLPFEIASLILLAAMVGAIVVARRKTES